MEGSGLKGYYLARAMARFSSVLPIFELPLLTHDSFRYIVMHRWYSEGKETQ